MRINSDRYTEKHSTICTEISLTSSCKMSIFII